MADYPKGAYDFLYLYNSSKVWTILLNDDRI